MTQWIKSGYKNTPCNDVLWIAAVLLFCVSTITGIFALSWIPSFTCGILIIAYLHRSHIKDFLQKVKIDRIKLWDTLEICFSMQENSIKSIRADINDILDLLSKKDISSQEDMLKIQEKSQNIKRRIEEVQEKITNSKEKIAMPQRGDLLSKKDLFDAGDNANGQYVKFTNGLMITTTILAGIGSQEYASEQILITYPAMFARAPFFVQFIGMEQPEIIYMGDGNLKIELKKRITTTVTMNVMGMWKHIAFK